MVLLDNPYSLVLLSIGMHVTWNLLARQVDRQANFLWWGILAHLVLLGPWGIYQLLVKTQWHQGLVFALMVTAITNTTYFYALRKAYAMAPVALVYPLARSAPILIAIWSWCFFDQGLSMAELIAIMVSIAGLWLLASTAYNEQNFQVIAWTSLAALSTSIYSVSDKYAVQSLTSFGQQLGYISVGYSAAWLGLTVQQKVENGHWFPKRRPAWSVLLAGGLCIGMAYALVVRAMLQLPAAHTVAFTNGGIAVAVLLSIFAFHETHRWQARLLATLVMCVGLTLLALY